MASPLNDPLRIGNETQTEAQREQPPAKVTS